MLPNRELNRTVLWNLTIPTAADDLYAAPIYIDPIGSAVIVSGYTKQSADA